MGHHDEIIFGDAHFPGESCNDNIIRADGLCIDHLLDAVLPLLVLDHVVENPVMMMEPLPEDKADAKIAAASGKAMVVGTTGFSNDQFSEFKKTLEPVPCVFAPSFSVGVTALIKLVEEAARIMGDQYDVEIVEAHHHFKADAPSGTALVLAKAAARGLERNLDEVGLYGRHGDVGARTKEEIGIHAVSDAVEQAVGELPPTASHRRRLEVAVETHMNTLLRYSVYTSANIAIFAQVSRKAQDRNRLLRKHYASFWNDLFQAAQAAGEIHASTDLSLVRLFLLGSVNWSMQWYDPKKKNSIDELAQNFCAMLFDGIGP